MSADTPYKDECWEYIKYMSAGEKVQGEMEIIGLPALKAISEDSEFINTIPDGWKSLTNLFSLMRLIMRWTVWF